MIRIENLAGSGRDLEVRRVVVKLGSNVTLTGGARVDIAALESIADDVVKIRNAGARVIIVTSGAVGLGCGRLGRPRPTLIPERQAMAAIGQIGLMRVYEEILAARGVTAAQILLTRADMDDRRRYLNARHTLEMLLEVGAVPIINENDAVSTEELSFGDNDMLSAYVAVKVKADLLCLLSTVPGVLSTPPGGNGAGAGVEAHVVAPPTIIPLIEDIDAALRESVDDSRSSAGMGGMTGKLAAAQMAREAGVDVVIAGGKTPGILGSIMTGKFVGTYAPAARERSMSALERWIGFGRPPQGRAVAIDAGAVEALLARKGSLLPVGVTAVSGPFERGDCVDITDGEGRVVARGLVNYSSEDIDKIKRRRSAEIESILGQRPYEEIIHRDNLAVLKSPGRESGT